MILMHQRRACCAFIALAAGLVGTLTACGSASESPTTPTAAAGPAEARGASGTPFAGNPSGPSSGLASTPPSRLPTSGAAAGASPKNPGQQRLASCSGHMVQAQLQLAASSSAGRRAGAVGLRNTSTRPCGIDGHPDLQLLGRDADPISTVVVAARSHSPIRLAPGATAWATLTWSTLAGADEPRTGTCEPAASRLAVFAPQDQTQLDVVFSGGPVCQHGRIEVGAFGAKSPTA